MFDLGVLAQHALVVALGAAAAGAASSVYRMIIDAPPRFDKRPEATGFAILHVLLMLFAGPFVLARNSIRARQIENRALGWVGASGAIAATWCLMSGLFILTILNRMTGWIG